MLLRCKFDVSLERSDPHHFVRHLHIDVISWDERANEYLVGKVAVDQVLWSEAETAGVALFDVCDADSQGLYEVFATLFGPEEDAQDFLPEFGITEPVDHFVFIWKAAIHPNIRHYEQAVVDRIGTLFGHSSILTMWKSVTNLTERELADLGFRRIASSSLLFRPSMLRYPYADEHPAGECVDVTASAEQQEWVLSQWGDLDHQ